MRQGSRAGWWDLLEFQRNEATDWEILDIVFKALLLLGQGPWGAGLETNPGSQRDICTALMPSCLSRRRVLLSNIWFGLDPPALFSLSYHRILSFPTCRLFFFPCQNVVLLAFVGRVRMKSGIISSQPLQSSSSPGSGAWFLVFFQGNPAGSSAFHQSTLSVTHGLCGGTSLRGRGEESVGLRIKSPQ